MTVTLQEHQQSSRQYYIDWLRIFATFMMFIYHVGLVFDFRAFHIGNLQRDLGISIFTGFVREWIMPLFFIISGMSVFFSLRRRSKRTFIKERAQRLIVPYIFGSVFPLMVPLIVYYERVHHSLFSGSFIEFYPQYFNGINWYQGGNFHLTGAHLWYLLVLFLFCLLTILLFIYLMKQENQEKIAKIIRFFQKPGTIFLLVIPLFLTEILTPLIPFSEIFVFTRMQILTFLIFFIIGFLFALNSDFKEIIKKNAKYALILGIIGSIVCASRDLETPIYIDYNIISLFQALASFCWVIVILYLGAKYLDFNHKRLKFLNSIVLPFYIIHVVIIVTFGFYIIQLNLIIFLKYTLIASLSFVAVMGLILIIRKSNILRFLFGMKLKKKEKYES